MQSLFKLLSKAGHKTAQLLGERTDFGIGNSPSRTRMNEMLQQFGIYELLPYRAFSPGEELFYNDGSVGFVFETSPLVGCSEKMQREISGLFQHTLPEGSSLQFILWADPRIGGILEAWKGARSHIGNGTPDIFRTLAQRRVDFLARQAFDSTLPVPLRNFRCLISYSQKVDAEITPEGLDPIEKAKLLSLKEQIKTSLQSLGMPLWTLSAGDLLNTLDGIINFGQQTNPADLRWNPYDSLHLQIPSSSSLQIGEDGISVGEGKSEVRTYSVRREPDQWSMHAMGELIGDPLRDLLQIPCPFMIHYGVHVPFQEKTKTRVQSRESWVESQARSKIGKHIPVLLAQARELEFVRNQLSRGERFVQTSLTVTLFSESAAACSDEQMLKSLFRSKRWQLAADSYIQLPSFLATLPMNWGGGLPQDLIYLQKLKTTLSTEAANLLPLQGEWKGTGSNSGMMLVGRRGQLLTWSPFDNQTGNYNVAVVGKSGSGKSVFMQELVVTTLSSGGQVFVMDVGRSFERTAKLLGGTYIEFTAQTALSINPFSTIPTDSAAEAEDALSMLKPILSLIAAPKDGTNDLENSYLEQALKMVWGEERRRATISSVADFLVAHKDLVAQKLGQKLFPYTRHGGFGRFFEGPSTVDLTAPLVLIELEELKERKDLQEVIVQMCLRKRRNPSVS